METNGERESGAVGREWSGTAVVEALAERMGSADARTVYGNPIERDGVTVIPVARVRYGFGGGTGRKRTGAGEGTGGGARVSVTPLGYIEIIHHRVRFRRIRTPSAALTALGLGLALWLSARLVRVAIAKG